MVGGCGSQLLRVLLVDSWLVVVGESGSTGVDGRVIRFGVAGAIGLHNICLLYTSPSPRDLSTSRMPSSA